MSFFNNIGTPTQQPSMNNPKNLIQCFHQFQKAFTGDADQQIQQLMNAGRVTQAQYNQAVQMAQQFKNMLGWK